MSSFRDSEFDRFLSSCLEGAVAWAEPSPAAWESIERQVLAAHDGPSGHGSLRGLAHVLKHQLLQIERHFFSVPVQYQRLSENRMAMFVQAMAYPGAGCVPLAFV
jgi:hypothetical protein